MYNSALAVLGKKLTPALLAALKRRMTLSSMWSAPPAMKRIPFDGGLTPKMSRPRMKTTSVAAALMTIPLPPASAPPSV